MRHAWTASWASWRNRDGSIKELWIVWHQRDQSRKGDWVWYPANDKYVAKMTREDVCYRTRMPSQPQICLHSDVFPTTPRERLHFDSSSWSYPLMQFWTLTAHFETFKIDAQKACRRVVDRDREFCGAIHLDGQFTIQMPHDFDFLVLSNVNTAWEGPRFMTVTSGFREWLQGLLVGDCIGSCQLNRVEGLPREGNLDNSTRERLKRLYRWDHYEGNSC